MLRHTYDTMLRLAMDPRALWILAAVSFIESSVFPITPLVMLAPMVLARPDRAWLIAGVCTLASVAGGVFGWWIGYALFEEVGLPVLELYGKADEFADIAARFRELGAEAVLFAAVTPFPYKVVTIFSGVAGLDLWLLIGASLVGRAIQFFLVAGILWKFGPVAKPFIEERLGMVTLVGGVLIIGGFVAVRFLH